MKVTHTPQRKDDHIRINLEENVQSGISTGLEKYHFVHHALPEQNLDAVDTRIVFLGKRLNAPILISSMTGGTARAEEINRNLATAAERYGIAMGLGSQRAAIEDNEHVKSFKVRQYAPSILLFANLGAIQLNYGYSWEDCQRAVEMVEADGLILHLNPLQEAVQPEGDTNWFGLLDKIETVCTKLSVPVIVKEVGWGISAEIAKMLISAGVDAIDVAGAGGTSWSQVEKYRAANPKQYAVASAFKDWGIPTSDAILNVRSVSKEIPLIASGGLKNGVEIAKCIALGADMCGLAGYFLRAATQSLEAIEDAIDIIIQQIQITMFSIGVSNIQSLKYTQKLRKIT